MWTTRRQPFLISISSLNTLACRGSKTFVTSPHREPNVYAGLVVTAFIHKRPHYFGEILGELLFWLGADRILYGSDYGIWSPKWIVDEIMNFELPAEVTADTGQTLTLEVRRKIMVKMLLACIA